VEGVVNNLVYGNQQPEKLAAGVEEIVRKDTGSATPLPYRMLDVAAGKATVGSVLIDIGNVLGSGQVSPLLTVELDLPSASPATLQAQLIRQGVGAYCGSLVFVFRLPKACAGDVSIEEHKSFGTPRFTGEPMGAARLNGVKDLAKRADKVLRSETEMGSIKVKIPRVFRLSQAPTGSVLVFGTLPRLTSMGMGATTDAREIIDLAAAVEAAL
jgi:hypothetical protein